MTVLLQPPLVCFFCRCTARKPSLSPDSSRSSTTTTEARCSGARSVVKDGNSVTLPLGSRITTRRRTATRKPRNLGKCGHKATRRGKPFLCRSQEPWKFGRGRRAGHLTAAYSWGATRTDPSDRGNATTCGPRTLPSLARFETGVLGNTAPGPGMDRLTGDFPTQLAGLRFVFFAARPRVRDPGHFDSARAQRRNVHKIPCANNRACEAFREGEGNGTLQHRKTPVPDWTAVLMGIATCTMQSKSWGSSVTP